MTKTEYAAKMGITIEQLNKESLSFLLSEGYDEDGREYETLDEWIKRKPCHISCDPVDGGRGFGTYGIED